ncbi:patatin-domain-containing protein [Amylostereum chailletii]|nr:patatin-domain-containing protein [Amylostereum chailletii]
MTHPARSPCAFSAAWEFSEDYANEDHIKAFQEALHADDNTIVSDPLPSPTSNSRPSTPVPHSRHGSTRIRKVSALSDFAPVNVKVKRRKKGSTATDKRRDWLFLTVRWPLLFFIFLFIACEFGFYVLIRQLVNAKEWLSAWRGRKGLLRKRLRASNTYEEWKDAAAILDDYLGFNDWKKVDEDAFYDWKLVRKVKRSLSNLRQKNDARGVLGVLETCMRANFAGVESTRLYSETFFGTKDLIESYITEQELALEYIRETPLLSIEEKKRFFKGVNTHLGLTALCLSGGATFGYYHFGVVKAFLDAGCLPRVITGTSAGGLVAALVGTRTDVELKSLLIPELANKITACEDPFGVWFHRFWRTGARFNSVTWAKKCSWFTRGSMTFREAYMRTGRVLNVSVIPADRHSPTKLLNYITAPDTIIWSALLASAAVPGILNPVVLMQKLSDGRVVPWNWGSRFKDGSLRVDIPVQSLNLYFNVTHPVVSQANPHVHLFFFAPRGSAGKPVAHRKGKGWRGNFLLSAAEQWLKLELTKNFKLIRDLELLPTLLGQDWSSVFLQRFEGTVTIWPRTRFLDWVRILSDPDPPELERMIRVGKMVTWPKLHMIENRLRLERQIYLGRQAVRRAQQPRAPPFPSPALLPSTGAESSAAPLIAFPSGDGTEPPLSLDTDAESAFINGTRWFFKRGHTSAANSGDSTPRDAEERDDPLRTPTMRRRWTEDLFRDPGVDTSEEQATLTVNGGPPKPKGRPGSFFSRLRNQSFAGLTPQFHSPRTRHGQEPNTDAYALDPAWSSDSSSGEELSLEEPRHAFHPSQPGDLEQVYPDDTGGDADDTRGDKEDDEF